MMMMLMIQLPLLWLIEGDMSQDVPRNISVVVVVDKNENDFYSITMKAWTLNMKNFRN